MVGIHYWIDIDIHTSLELSSLVVYYYAVANELALKKEK